MLTVVTLLKLKPSPNGEQHGERAFWREHGEKYLVAWLTAVHRFIPKPHHVVVMTDSADLLITRRYPCDVHFRELDRYVDAPGFWAKLHMFSYGDKGKCLYLDLDNVINGPLDELCALEPDPLIMLDDRRVPGLPNGSAILFDAEKCRGIWDRYAGSPRRFEQYHVAYGQDYSRAYDQAFISDYVCGVFNRYQVTFFQEMLPAGYALNARSELPDATDWQSARLIFGGGAEGKPHLSTHPAFSLR